jgi:hypothetical protein
MADVYDLLIDQGSRFMAVIEPKVEWLTTLTGYDARGQVRASRTLPSADAPVLFDFEPYLTLDAANGVVMVDIPANVTATLAWVGAAQYDMELFDSNPAHDVRFVQGEILVSREVTRQ